MTWEPLGGAGWNIVSGDLTYFVQTSSGGATSGGKLVLDYDSENVRVFQNTFTKTFRAVTIENINVEKWVGATAGSTSLVVQFRTSETFQALNIRAEMVDASNFMLTLYSTDFAGADAETVDTGNILWATDNTTIRVISDGSTVTLELDDGAGGWEDALSISTSIKLDRVFLITTDHSDTTKQIEYGSVGISHYDSASERHDLPTVTFDKPSVTGIHHTDFTVAANGADVDEWPGAVLDGNFDGALMANGETKKQTYGDFAYTVVGDVGVFASVATRVTTGSKEATGAILLADGTNELEKAGSITNIFGPIKTFTAVAPDLGAWTTIKFGLLEVGVRATNGTDGSQNVQLEAVGIEIFDFPADPPQILFDAGGITSEEAIGTHQVNMAIEGIGIASAEAIGTHTVTLDVGQAISPNGIASEEAIGSHQINMTVSAGGITSVEAIGVHQLNITIQPAGITSAEAIGAHQLNMTVHAGGIVSAEAIGSHQINIGVEAGGISSAEAIGAAQIHMTIEATGIVSAEAIGVHVVVTGLVAAGGIASQEAVGTHQLNMKIHPSGIASAEAIGTHTVSSASDQTINPTGIASAEAIGTHQLNMTVSAGGIASAEAVGTHQLNMTIASAGGIASQAVVGSSQINMTIGITVGIVSGEVIGAAQINITISAGGIASQEAVGDSQINMHIEAGGIVSTEAIGSHSIMGGLGVVITFVGSYTPIITSTGSDTPAVLSNGSDTPIITGKVGSDIAVNAEVGSYVTVTITSLVGSYIPVLAMPGSHTPVIAGTGSHTPALLSTGSYTPIIAGGVGSFVPDFAVGLGGQDDSAVELVGGAPFV